MIIFVLNIFQFLLKVNNIFINTYSQLNTFFSNREIAIGIWLIIFIILILGYKKTQKDFLSILKIVFSPKLAIIYTTLLIYTCFNVFILNKIGIWEFYLIKDTVLWWLIVAIPQTGKAILHAKDKVYFIDFIKVNIRLVLLIEFIVNLYSFSLLVELIGMPVLTIIIIIQEYIKKTEFKKTKTQGLEKFIEKALIVIGFIILLYSISQLYANWSSINIKNLIQEFSLPVILSISLVVYMYLFSLLSSYELMFIRLNFNKTISKDYRKTLYLKIILFCNFNLSKVKKFVSQSGILRMKIQDYNDFKTLKYNYRYYRKRDKTYK
ncbi:MAG TPA: hypothetical protein VK121_02520 [Pseudogracilibacillus sp.]|nr:hypothetical protein [Pseudogracilibacillus sp.]